MSSEKNAFSPEFLNKPFADTRSPFPSLSKETVRRDQLDPKGAIADLKTEWYFCPGGLHLDRGELLIPEIRVRDQEEFESRGRHSQVAIPIPGIRAVVTGNNLSDALSNDYLVASDGPQLLTNVFALHSKADARHTIYLDFNGHRTANTLWNSTYNNGNAFVTPAFTIDGSASFNAAERELILDIWRRVAEDFRPFNVNVTTQAPAQHELVKSGPNDQRWGIRVVIGGQSGQWLGGNSAGIAYHNSFNFDSDTPAFVFSGGFPITDKTVAEAVSHETGHSLGLEHDGQNSNEYYAGHGSGETGWAPIMGLGYYQNLTQWSRGWYANATNNEDDLRIITSKNGFGYRDDDHGGSTQNASILQLSNNHYLGNGIIERNNDSDFFSLGIQKSGYYQMNVMPFFKGPNLDLAVTLYDGAGNSLRGFNPTGEISVTTRQHLVAGHYFLAVRGVGVGGPEGYPGYGSLGQFSMRVIPINMEVTVPTIQVFQQDAAKVEGDSGITRFTFRLIRQGNLKIESTVDWKVRGVPLNNSVDRFDFQNNVFASGTATLEFGSHVTIISVPVKTDLVWEPHERMELVISNPVNGTITKRSVVGTIYNDDSSGGSALVAPQLAYDGSPDGVGLLESELPSETLNMEAITRPADLGKRHLLTHGTPSFADSHSVAMSGADPGLAFRKESIPGMNISESSAAWLSG